MKKKNHFTDVDTPTRLTPSTDFITWNFLELSGLFETGLGIVFIQLFFCNHDLVMKGFDFV